MRVDKKARALGLVAGLALVLTACGSDSDSGGATSDEVKGAKVGGTLRIKGAGDVDHLDTATAYYTVSYSILRGLSRQLVSYPNSKDPVLRDQPVADMAEGNEDDWRSSDGLTYTFKIKEGIKWGAPANRQVTAQDVTRGLKRLCDPNNPSGGLIYYTATIDGMKEFCDGFAKVKAGNVTAVTDYIDKNEIKGLTAKDESTVEFKLKTKAGDFLYMLAMPFASAVPVEMMKYIADSPDFRKNFISNGPYTLESYEADKSIKMARNPAWDAKTDKLRNAYVDRIEITEGSDEEPIQQELEAGTVDLAFDTSVPVARLAQLKNDPLASAQLHKNPDGCVGYMVFNIKKGGPMANLKVRQAINYAVNKKAIIQVAGGPDVYQPTGNVLTEPISGYEKLDLYPSPESAGDPVKAKALLAEAGFGNGLTLNYLYRNRGKHPQYATTHQAALKAAGITINLKPVLPAQFYAEHLSKISDKSWDIAQPGWCPDWAGNAARTFFSPLLDSRDLSDGTTNYGGYNIDALNKKIDEALAEPETAKAAKLWAEADKITMEEAVWVPIFQGNVFNFTSKRVKNWVYFPFAHQCDFTNVYLDPIS